MSVEWEWATDQVKPIADRLIADVKQHEDLKHAQILYVFRDVHAVARGRAILGKARKIAGLSQFLVDDESVGVPLFVLEFPKDLWEGMKPEQKRALVDHELSHLAVERNGEGEWVGRTRGHDVEEFLGVIQRNGLWKADVAALVKAGAGQMPLDFYDPDAIDDKDVEEAPAEPGPAVEEISEPPADDPEWDEAAPRTGLRVVPDPFAATGATP
ncbi:hypothetical protein G7075_00095 [Phycicoccus sp. HDW14]|uniref:putative metallopeptidase n=1 Tax=Phycicoccus sp. HDW14 TaxID=2714941 RepID=UPI00140BEDB3|nr:putative metallopeptidase [Phycicoccus sp. HDW14]QIM19896.1 hypothetical protein G7075_00095 [Phycicoccus sp. HDW14]